MGSADANQHSQMGASQQSTDLKGAMPSRTSGHAGSGAPAVAKQPPTSKPPAPPSSVATGSEADTAFGKRSPSVLCTPGTGKCALFAHLLNAVTEPMVLYSKVLLQVLFVFCPSSLFLILFLSFLYCCFCWRGQFATYRSLLVRRRFMAILATVIRLR